MLKDFLIALSILLSFAGHSSLCGEEKTGRIVVEIKGLKNNEGKARILIFSEKEKDYFPSDHEKAYRAHVMPASDAQEGFVFEGVPFGSYAVSVHHDENDDGRVNSNFLGIPKEGLGASNDAKDSFGPPPFRKAEVALNDDTLVVKINIVYP